jgi:hypothetical protein
MHGQEMGSVPFFLFFLSYSVRILHGGSDGFIEQSPWLGTGLGTAETAPRWRRLGLTASDVVELHGQQRRS